MVRLSQQRIGLYLYLCSMFAGCIISPCESKPIVQPHGVFAVEHPARYGNETSSPNGLFRCQFDASCKDGAVDYSVTKVNFFEGERQLFSLDNVAGNIISISNAGYLSIARLTEHEGEELINSFYSKDGRLLFTRTYPGANLFTYSARGNKYCIGTPQKCEIISLSSGTIDTYPSALYCDISMDETLVCLGSETELMIGRAGDVFARIPHSRPFHNEKTAPSTMTFAGSNQSCVRG